MLSQAGRRTAPQIERSSLFHIHSNAKYCQHTRYEAEAAASLAAPAAATAAGDLSVDRRGDVALRLQLLNLIKYFEGRSQLQSEAAADDVLPMEQQQGAPIDLLQKEASSVSLSVGRSRRSLLAKQANEQKRVSEAASYIFADIQNLYPQVTKVKENRCQESKQICRNRSPKAGALVSLFLGFCCRSFWTHI